MKPQTTNKAHLPTSRLFKIAHFGGKPLRNAATARKREIDEKKEPRTSDIKHQSLRHPPEQEPMVRTVLTVAAGSMRSRYNSGNTTTSY